MVVPMCPPPPSTRVRHISETNLAHHVQHPSLALYMCPALHTCQGPSGIPWLMLIRACHHVPTVPIIVPHHHLPVSCQECLGILWLPNQGSSPCFHHIHHLYISHQEHLGNTLAYANWPIPLPPPPINAFPSLPTIIYTLTLPIPSSQLLIGPHQHIPTVPSVISQAFVLTVPLLWLYHCAYYSHLPFTIVTISYM